MSSFLFHAVSTDGNKHNLLYPQENLTIDLFDEFISTVLEYGNTFIEPNDLLTKLTDPHKKYALLTFDDGYFNNTWIVDVLNKYNVPAVFFITSNLILENEKNWADIVYYERKSRGMSNSKIHNEIVALSSQRIRDIKSYLTREFGLKCFIPKGDQDRMMNVQELKEFSQSKFVHIGNHSRNHEALAGLSEHECLEELQESQEVLSQIIGYRPTFISYPYGSYNEDVIYIAKQVGFDLGITTIQSKNKIPITGNQLMKLNRFNPVVENDRFNFDSLRSPFQMKTLLKRLLQ